MHTSASSRRTLPRVSPDTLAAPSPRVHSAGMPDAALMQIFKAGRHTTAAGASLEFGEGDLEATAQAYDPALHEAPICVGHPASDLPAYGWINGLQARDGGLYAQRHQVEPQFAELVRKGRFKKISAAFYPPDSAANPVPGVYYLRHVAFLGAMPPGVKGLKPVAFEAGTEDGLVFAEMEFSDPVFDYIVRAFRGLRDFLIDKFDLDTAEKVLPEWGISSIDELARERPNPRTPPADAIPSAFVEGTHTTETDVSAEKIAQLEAELAAQKRRADEAEAARQADIAAASAAERKARHEAHVAFAEGLVAVGQLLPADRDLVVATLDAAAGDAPDTPVEFGEGDAKRPHVQALQALFAGLPKHALTDKHLAHKGDHKAGAAAAEDALEFGEHSQVDEDSLAAHRRALAISKERGIPYVDAAREARAGR